MKNSIINFVLHTELVLHQKGESLQISNLSSMHVLEVRLSVNVSQSIMVCIENEPMMNLMAFLLLE